MHPRPALLALAVALSCAGPAHAASPAPTTETADQFAARVNATFAEHFEESTSAAWLSQTYINGDTARIEALLPRGERIEAVDAARGTRRTAVLDKGKLAAVLFLTRDGELPTRDWLIAQLAEERAAPTLLAGRAPGPQADRGAVICACFDVGLNTIVAAIRDRQLADVAAIGGALQAGTNCGSCRPALARILSEVSSDAA